MNRRTLLKAISAVPALATCGPTAASSEAYTVDKFAADLREAGANPKWLSSGVMMNVDGVDVEAQYAASRKAETAGITTRDLWEYLKPSSKFVGDGWYTHKEPVGTMSVWFISRYQVFDGPDGDFYRVYHWPGPRWHDDFDYLTRDEVETFIHAAKA